MMTILHMVTLVWGAVHVHVTAPSASLRVIHQPKEFTGILASVYLFLLLIRHVHI